MASLTSRVALGLAAAAAVLPSLAPATGMERAAVGGNNQWLMPSSAWSTSSKSPGKPKPLPLPQRGAIQRDYELKGVLGEGGFARVHLGRHRASRTPVAIKRVAKSRTTRAQFLEEVAILERVGGAHHVLALREAFETADAFVLVTELVRGGELYDDLLAHGVFSERDAQAVTRELAQSLAYLHAQAVVHADVKPENILLERAAGRATAQLRLIDFGQAFRVGGAAGAEQHTPRSSTLAYAAPEMLAAERGDKAASPGPVVDVWALGVVLYVLLCGQHPFDPTDDATDAEIERRVRAGEVDRECAAWRRLSPAARELIDQMLTLDPAARPSAVQVLAHPWMTAGEGVAAQ